jgi:hypothetical protein
MINRMNAHAMPLPDPHDDDAAAAEAKAAAVARGRAAAREGRVVDHSEVRAWALSLGTDNPLPRPRSRCK